MTKLFTASQFWNDRYQEESYIYGLQPNDFLKEHIGLFKSGSHILSLAEGEGRNAVFLAQHGHHVRGVDFSIEGREKAFRLAKQNSVRIEYDIADLTEYDIGKEKWDGIVSIFCHLSEIQRKALYQSVKQALKPGGIFILESYNKKQLEYETGGPKDAEHLVSLNELKSIFDGFEIILAQDAERNIHEGVYHTGKGSVTQLIAKRPA